MARMKGPKKKNWGMLVLIRHFEESIKIKSSIPLTPHINKNLERKFSSINSGY